MVTTKHLCCMLTDDLFFYNGIRDLYPEIGILRESLAGDALNLPCGRNVATVIVDGRILLGGKWHGYEKLIENNPDINTIWMLHRSVCGFFKCDNFLSCICAYNDLCTFRSTLLDKIENKDGVAASYCLLNSYEKTLLPYFIDGIAFDVLAKFFKCSEKTLHSHRLNIASKFGFRSALHMSSILYRVSPSLIDKL